MAEKPQNCWEHMNCGREPGGNKVDELGVCPAAIEPSFDGINRGENGGRICWFLSRTLCTGKRQDTFATKRKACFKCSFFNQVMMEEGRKFVFTIQSGISSGK